MIKNTQTDLIDGSTYNEYQSALSTEERAIQLASFISADLRNITNVGKDIMQQISRITLKFLLLNFAPELRSKVRFHL